MQGTIKVGSDLQQNDSRPISIAELACEEIKRRVSAKGYGLVDFRFTELSGRPWRLSMSADSLSPAVFSNGVIVDGKQVGGTWEGLISIRPDAASAFPDPRAASPTLSIMCDIVRASGEAYIEDSRSALKRAEAYFRLTQPGAVWAVGAEVEFFISGSAGEQVSDEALREILRAMWSALSDADVRVDWFRTGPANGQGRVQMRSGSALQTADQIVVYKNVVRSVAAAHGKTAKFLPKPFPGEGCISMFVHHAIWRDGVNLFHDPQGWAHTSELGRWFAGGLLRHASALLAFCAPTVNSYRRLLPGYPGTERALSTERNSAACRVPAGTSGPVPASRRIKFCSGDPTANPYLAFSAMLMAGLDGIRNRIVPAIDPPGRTEPMPQSLEAALEALSSDRAFLTAGGVFSDALINGWLSNRWKQQILPIRAVPHPMELRLDEQES
jgi:glutamine synthetase